MLEVCTAQTEPRIAQVLASSMTCHPDELNASQQPREPNSFLVPPQQLQARAPPQHACFVVSLQLAKSSSQDCFSFPFTFKAHQKMSGCQDRKSSCRAGWWFLGGWHDGCAAYTPCIYLGEPGPPEKDNFQLPSWTRSKNLLRII